MKKKYLEPRIVTTEFKIENGFTVSGVIGEPRGITTLRVSSDGLFENSIFEEGGPSWHEDGGNEVLGNNGTFYF